MTYGLKRKANAAIGELFMTKSSEWLLARFLGTGGYAVKEWKTMRGAEKRAEEFNENMKGLGWNPAEVFEMAEDGSIVDPLKVSMVTPTGRCCGVFTSGKRCGKMAVADGWCDSCGRTMAIVREWSRNAIDSTTTEKNPEKTSETH
jgi:hypothetical protein